jgi:hypothetical protein
MPRAKQASKRNTGRNDSAKPRIKTNLRDALSETHKAIAVLDHVHAALMLLMELSPPALEVLRDEFERMANERMVNERMVNEPTGPRGELKRAWYDFTSRVVNDASLRNRRGEFALYGELKAGRDYEAR